MNKISFRTLASNSGQSNGRRLEKGSFFVTLPNAHFSKTEYLNYIQSEGKGLHLSCNITKTL
jgi:hypothetical protein